VKEKGSDKADEAELRTASHVPSVPHIVVRETTSRCNCVTYPGHLAKEHSMDSKSRFYALEVMCRERARLADKESNYWLAEAEEWARLRQSCKQWRPSSNEPSRLEEKENESLGARPGDSGT
jgi:hypothetical protein